MKNMKQYGLKIVGALSFAALLLSGCATDNTPKPTPLAHNAPSVIQVKTLWTRKFTGGNEGENLILGSALQGTTLITPGFNGNVVASDVGTGSILWHIHLDEHIIATPGTNANRIFIGTKNAYLYALDLNTGQVVWHTALPSVILGAPTAADDVVAVLCHDSTVVVLSADTGKILWSYQATSPSLTLYRNSSPIINNNTVYVGFDNGQLGAFDLYRGIESWQVPVAIESSTEAVQNMVDIDGTPAMDNGVLFVTSYHGTLSAINMTNGSLIWQRPNSSFESPAIQNNKVVVVDETGKIQAFDESTGAPLWQQKDLLYRFISNPAVINNEAVVGDLAGYVHFISLDDGSLLARVQIASKSISAAPIVDNNEVIVTADDGTVAVLQPSQ